MPALKIKMPRMRVVAHTATRVRRARRALSAMRKGGLDAAFMVVLLAMLTGASGVPQESSVTAIDVVSLLREFGFPIFVAVWFMYRLEKRVEAFTDSINKLLTIVTVMSKTIDDQGVSRTRTRPGVSPVSGKDVA